MRRVVTLIIVLASHTAFGQGSAGLDGVRRTLDNLAPNEVSGSVSASSLPDSPGVVRYPVDADGSGQSSKLSPAGQDDVVAVAMDYRASEKKVSSPCHETHWYRPYKDDLVNRWPGAPSPNNCVNILDPYVRFLDTRMAIPMSPAQKGYLAFRNLSDPFNLATIIATSGFTIGIDSHTAYGPGWKGFGKIAGVSLLQDATGEFFGTFAIPSLTHEDPHYHRMPQAGIPRRLLHAISRTVIAQHDDGSPMPNYATLLTYPIASEISNLYVPGIHGNGESTTKRIFIGYALDPVNNIVTEFLPDLAKHVHIRVIFVQQILNQIVAGPALSGQTASQ